MLEKKKSLISSLVGVFLQFWNYKKRKHKSFVFAVLYQENNDLLSQIGGVTLLKKNRPPWSGFCHQSSPITTDDLLCYDIEKDSVWTLKFPKMPVECVRRQLHYFGVCGDGLRLIENYYKQRYAGGTFASSFDVMEMNQLQLQQQHQDHQDGNLGRDLWTLKYHVNIGEEVGYYANLIRAKSLMFGVFIMDLYKTTTKAARGEVEEVLLLCINNDDARLVISFNLSDNTFGKELRHNEVLCRDHFFGFTSVVPYANITLFPLLH